jgi:DNA-binding response OmpR family regulator
MGRHVLLCDDEKLIHQLLAEYLGGLGFQVDLAANFGECTVLLQKNIPDVILLDTDLPNGGALKTIQEVRAMGLKTPVLLMSINSEVSSDKEAVKMGADGFIGKPFSVKSMLDRINHMVQGA